jgi:hypothetical protein
VLPHLYYKIKEELKMSNPLENNMVLYYLNALGSGLAGPDDPMQQVGAVTKQTIAAQSQMNLIKKFLSGGGNLSQKEGKINYTGDVSAFLTGDEKSALGTVAPSALTEDVGNLYKPKAAPGGGGMDASKLMLMNLLGGGNALNPSDSSLDVSGADLVGLTPENITQALQLKLAKESLEQKKLSDIYKMIQTPQPGPAAPIETPGIGKLSLKQWSSLPTEDRSYYLYAASAKQKSEEVMSKEDWMAETDTSTRIQYLKELEKDKDLKALAIELSGGVKINLGEQAIQRGMGKDIAYVTGPKISQDILDDLDKDPERLREQPYVKKYMTQGMKYEEAQARARKATHRAELHRQLQIAYDKLGKIVEYGRYGFEVDGKIVQRY